MDPNDVHYISHLYNYLSTPPYGTGTCVKLVMETCERAKKYANKDFLKKTLNFNDEMLYSQKQKDGNPIVSKDIQGFHHERSCVKMILDFASRYKDEITNAAIKTVKWAHKTSVSELGKGRQTLNVLDGQTMKASAALERFCHFLNINGYPSDHSLIGFCEVIISLFEKDEIVVERTLYKRVQKVRKDGKVVYKSKGRSFMFVKEDVRRVIKGDEKNLVLWDMLRTLETFRKDAERGKSVRRAIASPGIPLRAFLRITEEFAKNLCDLVPESTISVGGDEKKDKIQQMLNTVVSKLSIYPFRLIGTGDNSKWNETQSPELMMTIAKILLTYTQDIGDEINKNIFYHKQVLLRILKFTFSVMFQKKLNCGLGVRVVDESNKEFKYMKLENFIKEVKQKGDLEDMSQNLEDITRENSIITSCGMVMGMLNIYSTLVGLIAGTYNNDGRHDGKYLSEVRKGNLKPNFVRQDLRKKVVFKTLEDLNTIRYSRASLHFLQSSDDFFFVALGMNEEACKAKCMEFFSNCKIMGVNWSCEKTMIREWKMCGVGEYTSWFVNGSKLINQWGSDTAQMRPTGINCQSDVASFVQNLLSKLTTRNINYIGAEMAIRIHRRLLRVLYHIKRGETPMGLPENMVCMANGGIFPYTPSTLHLSETGQLLFKHDQLSSGRINHPQFEIFDKYIRRLVNPKCPLNFRSQNSFEFDPDLMSLVEREVGIIMNCNNIRIRSNKKLSNKKMEENNRRNSYGIAEKIANYIKPTLSALGSNAKISLKIVLLEQLDLYLVKVGSYPQNMHVMLKNEIFKIKKFLETL